MRYLKIASAKNPSNDYIELNDFNGFLCTQFQTLGISRSVEFLTIKNRNIPVDNKPVFKRYSLTIEILTKYIEYENKYYQFLNFLDRNKNDGFRLYYKPFNNMSSSVYEDRNEGRYCLCSVENSSKVEKRQPIVLNLTQNSLWLGEQNTVHSSIKDENTGNLFAFTLDPDIPLIEFGIQEIYYYRASFEFDNTIPFSNEQEKYYCMAFYNGTKQEAEITISSYNDVPLNIVVYGSCTNPEILVYKKNKTEPIRKFQVFEEIGSDFYLEINSSVPENGVWLVDKNTGAKQDLVELVNYANGSPYFYLDNGEYYITVSDSSGNQCVTDISWREEYSE